MIGHVDYHIVHHCNFHCAGCNQFSCLAQPWFVPYEQFYEEWKTVRDKGLQFGEIRLLGGEPLLHPELGRLLTAIRELIPNTKIVVYTNAILLKKRKEELLPVFNDNKITLFISKYSELKLDYAELERGFNDVTSTSATSFMNTCLHKNPDFNAEEMYRQCNNSQSWQCRFLKENRLYTCSMIPNLCFLIQYFPELHDTPLGQMNIEENGIDIRTHTVGEIEEFLKHSIPACAFCNVPHAKRFHGWYPSEYKITEWIE